MARRYARLWLSIWDDDDFTSLDPATQNAYLALISSRDLSWCGVAPMLPKRLARLSKGLTERKVAASIDQLEAHSFVVTDSDTDEILVRRFVHYDEVIKQPNVAKAMCSAMDRVHSQRISDAIDAELRREFREEPDLKGWDAIRSSFPEVYAKASANPSGNPSAKGSAIPFRKGA